MSARAQMTHRCVIERDATAGASDSFDFQPYLADVPCRLWATGGREAVDASNTTVIEDLRCVIPLGTDVVVTDRLHGVTDRRGKTIDARALGIASILAKRDHLELLLQERVW